jgi:hypothetical protein
LSFAEQTKVPIIDQGWSSRSQMLTEINIAKESKTNAHSTSGQGSSTEKSFRIADDKFSEP